MLWPSFNSTAVEVGSCPHWSYSTPTYPLSIITFLRVASSLAAQDLPQIPNPTSPNLESLQWGTHRDTTFSRPPLATSPRMVQAWTQVGPLWSPFPASTLRGGPMSGPRREGQSTTTSSSSSSHPLQKKIKKIRMNRTLIQTFLIISGTGWCMGRPHQTTPPEQTNGRRPTRYLLLHLELI